MAEKDSGSDFENRNANLSSELIALEDIKENTLGFNSKVASQSLNLPSSSLNLDLNPESGEVSPERSKRMSENSRDPVEKLQESKEFARKMNNDQLKRKKRVNQREKEKREKILQEIEEINKRRDLIDLKKIQEKQEKLHNVFRSSEIRKEKLKSIQVSHEFHQSKKPLYIQMEQNYQQQFVLPSMEEKKKKIAQKKLIFQPLDHEDLIDHYKKHEEYLKAEDYRRRKEKHQKAIENEVNLANSPYFSKFTYAITEQDRRSKEEYEAYLKEKKNNARKRMQYSKIVKEMFPPIIDERKRLEVSLDIDYRTTKRIIPAGKSLGSLPFKENFERYEKGEHQSASESCFKPKKWKKNPMVPDPPPKKIVIKKDYLAEKRKQREEKDKGKNPEDYDWEKEISTGELDSLKIDKIKAKAALIEKKALKQEKRWEIIRNLSSKGVEASSQINDMIISSIKAKLAILEKVEQS